MANKTTKRTALKKEKFLSVFKEKAGNISKACEAINIARTTYYDWKRTDKNFAQAVDDISEGLIDWAEDALKKQMQDGSVPAVIFFLKTKGKSRGYIEDTRHILEGGEKPVPIKYVKEDEGEKKGEE